MNRQRKGLSSKTFGLIGAAVFLALFVFLKSLPFSNYSPAQLFPTNPKMGIIHIVMIEFKEETTADQITDLCDRMMALKDKCVLPTTNKPYIKMSLGGKQNSPEGLAGGITHAFVEEFENEEDRKYYLEKDPAHLAFVASIGALVSKVQVVDFTPGTF